MRLCFASSVLVAHAIVASIAAAQPGTSLEQALQRGREALLARNGAEAVAQFEAAARLAPDNALVLFELADAYVELGGGLFVFDPGAAPADRARQLDKAVATLQRAAVLDATLAPVVSNRLISLYDRRNLNRPALAEPLVRQLVAERPTAALWRSDLADVLAAQGRYADAAQAYVEAVRQVDPDGRMALAISMVESVRDWQALTPADARRVLDAALAVADERIAAAPTEPEPHGLRSQVLHALAERATDPARRQALERESEAAFHRFVQLNAGRRTPDAPGNTADAPTIPPPPPPPPPPPAWMDEWEALAKAGRKAEAEQLLARLAATRGNDPEFWRDAAAVRTRDGDFDRARAALTRWTELDPGNAEAHHSLATFLWDLAYRDKQLPDTRRRELATAALASSDKALSLNPDYMEAVVYRGLILKQLASVEPDTARQAALTAEAEAMSARAKALREKRASGVR